MPHTDRDGALRMAERVRELVLALAIEHDGTPAPGVVTISIGAATAWPRDPGSGLNSVSELLEAADAALYQAKSGGRNRVVFGGRNCAAQGQPREKESPDVPGNSSGTGAG
jgi:diguanylate cyclase (GGDEF)-like protein